MDNFIKFTKKYWIFYVIVIVAIIAPFVLNKLFHIPAVSDWLEYEENTGDLLSYVTSMLSVIGTIFLGIVTYNQNKRLIKLESNSKAVFFKINIDKCQIVKIKDNFHALIEFENINQDVPISKISVIESNVRLIKNEFKENNKGGKYTFITKFRIDINAQYTYDAENINYSFDLSDYKAPYKILSFGIKTESLFGIENEQLFNIFIIQNKVKDYMTSIK